MGALLSDPFGLEEGEEARIRTDLRSSAVEDRAFGFIPHPAPGTLLVTQRRVVFLATSGSGRWELPLDRVIGPRLISGEDDVHVELEYWKPDGKRGKVLFLSSPFGRGDMSLEALVVRLESLLDRTASGEDEDRPSPPLLKGLERYGESAQLLEEASDEIEEAEKKRRRAASADEIDRGEPGALGRLSDDGARPASRSMLSALRWAGLTVGGLGTYVTWEGSASLARVGGFWSLMAAGALISVPLDWRKGDAAVASVIVTGFFGLVLALGYRSWALAAAAVALLALGALWRRLFRSLER